MPETTPRNAWVIKINKDGFEGVLNEQLVQHGTYWFNEHTMYRKDTDIFDTELDARNECEKRLYERSEKLRTHREQMSRLLVNCAPPMPKGGA